LQNLIFEFEFLNFGKFGFNFVFSKSEPFLKAFYGIGPVQSLELAQETLSFLMH
jgi:hypothetical protein